MLNQDAVTQLTQLMANAGTVMVVLRVESSFDQTATATALRLALTASGREADLVAPEPLVSEAADGLIGIDQVKTDLGNKHLSISFEYNEQAVDKVSYHIDEDDQRFYLLIKPQKHHRPLDSSKVSFAYTGAEADLVFLVGIHSLESLDQLYFNYRDFFDQTTAVVLHRFEPRIGQLRFDSSGMSSLSELTLQLLESLELPINVDVATNLLAGIEDSTNGFRSPTTTAETFECVARLMRYGARRLPRRAVSQVEQPSSTREQPREGRPDQASQPAPSGQVVEGEELAPKPSMHSNFRQAMPSAPPAAEPLSGSLADRLQPQAHSIGSLADKLRRAGQPAKLRSESKLNSEYELNVSQSDEWSDKSDHRDSSDSNSGRDGRQRGEMRNTKQGDDRTRSRSSSPSSSSRRGRKNRSKSKKNTTTAHSGRSSKS